MPVLSSKWQSSAFDALAAKVEAKKKEEREKEIANEALKKFSTKSLDKEKNASIETVLASPNYIRKRFINKKDDATLELDVSVKVSAAEEQQKQEQIESVSNKEADKNANATDGEKKSEKSSSIISGSPKLQELQEIQKQLNKSYEPKPLFEPRRPTLESIKSAIEKAKQDEARNKNVGTDGDDVISITATTDASTSVDKLFGKKKKKKKKTPDASSANSATGTSSASNKTKKRASPAPGKGALSGVGAVPRGSGAVPNKSKKKIDVNVKVKTKVEPAPSNTGGVAVSAKQNQK